MTGPRYTREEFAQRGDDFYEREIAPKVEHQSGSVGQYVAIDIETGTYEVDRDEILATQRLQARIPQAQIWLRRVGSRYVRRFGRHPRLEAR